MLYSSHQKGINQLSFKIELGTLKFCGNACKFQNSSPSLPGLTQNPFWLPYWINMMRLSCSDVLFLSLQLVSAPKKRSDVFSPSQKSHSIFDLIGQYCFCSCWRWCKSLAKVIPLRLLHPSQSSLPSQLTPHASLSQHRTWYCLMRAATTVIRILDLSNRPLLFVWVMWLDMIGHFQEAVFRKRRKIS